MIACDATQVLQVLLNLGVNARDVMPDGGVLGLGAANVEVDAQYANMNPGAPRWCWTARPPSAPCASSIRTCG